MQVLLTGNTGRQVTLLIRAAIFKRFLGCTCPQPRFSYTLAELLAVMGTKATDTNNVCEFHLP